MIRPLRKAAAVQADAGRGAAPLVGHAELSQGVPDGVGRHLVRRRAVLPSGSRTATPSPNVPGSIRGTAASGGPDNAAASASPEPDPSIPSGAETRAHRRSAAAKARPHRGRRGEPGRRGWRGWRRRRRTGQGGRLPVQVRASSSTTPMASASARCASRRSSSPVPGESRCGSSAAARASKRSTMDRNRALARATDAAAVPVLAPERIGTHGQRVRGRGGGRHEIGRAIGSRARPVLTGQTPCPSSRRGHVGKRVAHTAQDTSRIGGGIGRPSWTDHCLHLADRRRQRRDERAGHRYAVLESVWVCMRHSTGVAAVWFRSASRQERYGTWDRLSL